MRSEQPRFTTPPILVAWASRSNRLFVREHDMSALTDSRTVRQGFLVDRADVADVRRIWEEKDLKWKWKCAMTLQCNILSFCCRSIRGIHVLGDNKVPQVVAVRYTSCVWLLFHCGLWRSELIEFLLLACAVLQRLGTMANPVRYVLFPCDRIRCLQSGNVCRK